MKQRKSNIFILSAPSGAGKSTLIQLLLAKDPALQFSVSHTTRLPRDGEKNGSDYFFISPSEFESMIQAGEFLEWASVHGYFYGTSREMVRQAEEAGKDLILDIDVQGASQVRKSVPDALSIFVLPPSYETLRKRLEQRQKDSVQAVQKRLERARKEIEHCREYDYIIINEELNSAFDDLTSIIRGQRLKRQNLEERIENILKSFII